MKLRLGLTPKVALLFLAFGAALLAAVTLASWNSGRGALRDAAESRLQSKAIEKEAALNAWVEREQSAIASLAASPHLSDDLAALAAATPDSAEAQAAHDRIVSALRPWAGEERKFLSLMLIDPESGEVVVSSDPSEEKRFKEDRPYYINGREGAYTQGPYYSITLQDPAMTSSAPVALADGPLLGVLAGYLDLDEMNAIVTRHTGRYETADTFLVNSSNLFITQPRLVSDEAVLQHGVHTEGVNSCLGGSSGITEHLNYRGVTVLAAYRWLPGLGICLISEIDVAEALERSRSFAQTVLIVGALGLGVAAVVAVGLGRTIAGPIRRLQAGAARIGRGDLDARLPETPGDELGQLAREFNSMAATLSQKDAQLRGRATELEAANRELEAFSYSVSHDLRAPLRGVDGFSQMLLEDYGDRLDAEGKDCLRRVRAGTQRIGQLIDDLLTLSRVTRGEMYREPVDLSRLAQATADDLRKEGPERKAEFIIEEGLLANGDPQLLDVALENLLGNAWKFTSKHEKARIEFGAVRQQTGEMAYFVRDDGAGFDMAYADKLFGPFQRLHGTNEFSGSGIGLASVQRIIRRHGGRVWAEGEVEHGATFYFTLQG